jgi:hypothetical protein
LSCSAPAVRVVVDCINLDTCEDEDIAYALVGWTVPEPWSADD